MGTKKDKAAEKNKVYDISEVTEFFGRFQKMQFLYCCLPAIFVTMININYVFAVGDVNYRCRIPECDGNQPEYSQPWWPGSVDRCSRPVLEDHWNGTCSNTSFTGAVEKCSSWVYESNNTVVAELDLACQPWKSNLVGTVHSAGMVLSMTISGWLSDKFGRKPTLVICSIGGILGHLKTFVTAYYQYIIIEFLEAAITGGTYSAAMVIMIESSGKDHRVLAGVIFAYAIYVGEVIFACIAMVSSYWKTLIRIICSPPILFLSYTFLIKESPRWQILNNKIEQAKETLLVIADTNKLNIDRHDFINIDEAKLKNKFNLGSYEKKESWKRVFTSKEIWKRLLVLMVCRFTASFVYYGLMVNSVWLPGDKYTNFLLATVMSFPGELVALVLMNKCGRRLPLLYGYILCGALCIGSACVPEDAVWAKITLFLLGKMFIAACFTGAITYTMELFPTSARGTLMGLCSFMSRIGGMLAPITPILTPIHPALPACFFGASAVLSGICLLFTPETRNLPLMDTVDQVEISVKQAKREKKGLGSENPGFEDTAVTSL
ncbi:organic cation transporter protein-like [Cydia fagiglandana]|uniref:organic cation transporter protein-like n=1 Tax=Cydia fagiglandana TaxID=1458189 RepID=UPI002FEE264F